MTQLIFMQNSVTGPAGQAFIGAISLPVTVANDSGISLVYYLVWVPTGSALSPAVVNLTQTAIAGTPIGSGLTATFTPDVPDTYEVWATDFAGNIVAKQDFIVPRTIGSTTVHMPGLFSDRATFNYNATNVAPGQTNGWAKDINQAILAVGGGGGSGATFDTYANMLSASPTSGKLWQTSDGMGQFIGDGTSWRPQINGVAGYLPPALSAFTGGYDSSLVANTFALSGGGPTITSIYPTSTASGQCAIRTIPIGSTTTLIAKLRASATIASTNMDQTMFGIGVLDSSGRSNFFGPSLYTSGSDWLYTTSINFSLPVPNYTNPVSTPYQYTWPIASGWLKLTLSGANITCSASPDGVQWVDCFTYQATGLGGYGPVSPLTAWGFGIFWTGSNSSPASPGICTLQSWHTA
jgi:hypothetical protein